MVSWQQRPILYEINTWPWLNEIRQREGRSLTLAEIPGRVWDSLAALHIDAVWLMGIWQRSPAAVRIASEHPDLLEEHRRVLPDFSCRDVVGSPYAVFRYEVDPNFGNAEDLAAARKALAERRIALLLDFVPNHVAVDHPWVTEHPEYFIRGTEEDLNRAPGYFFRHGRNVLAHGRDPYFLPWTDTAQLDATQADYRKAAVQTLCDIATMCDGVRCDMAMLLVDRIFRQTWGEHTDASRKLDFWNEVIGAVRERNPDFLFLAEVYWDMEWELQRQGFDYCYDKRLYDRLVHETAESIRLHLGADIGFQERLVRFIENHDEPRAVSVFDPRWVRAAALCMLTLPGAKLLHEGQIEGRRHKVPVQLGRRPAEVTDSELRRFYLKLLEEVDSPVFRQGGWLLCDRSGWPDTWSYLNVVAWCWRKADHRRLIVINLSSQNARARVKMPWGDLAGRSWRLMDSLSGEEFVRGGDEMRDPGLYVELKGWGTHFLQFQLA
ncbi:MAG: hypothetical protein JW797_08915 [Bradymonadales bacterium]|nr:hypothetical protein [Bradymonadales bacterium]